jgi:hypothetical protein
MADPPLPEYLERDLHVIPGIGRDQFTRRHDQRDGLLEGSNAQKFCSQKLSS